MKAILLNQFGSADNFELADLPIPSIQKGEVRIRIKAASFNPVDYQIRKGLPESSRLTSNILGRDLSGIIDEVDETVSDLKVGDEVYSYVCDLASNGTYAEYCSVPAELVAKKPLALTFEEAACVPVTGITAMLALRKSNAGNSRSIFVAGGAGGVGTFVLLLAEKFGYKTIVTTAGNENSSAYLTRNFSSSVNQINYRDRRFIDKAIELNNGHFDIAIDLVGGPMLSACCQLLGIDGNLASAVEVPGNDDFEFLFSKNGSFHSIGANAYSLSKDRRHWLTYRMMLNELSAGFDDGILKKPPVTTIGGLSVETVREAHDLLENRSIQGKLVMTC